jgi:D-alanine-D-alanine ligase
MRLGLAFDLQTNPSDDRQAEFDLPGTIDALERALRSLGHQVLRLGAAADLLAAPWRLRDVDLVFNVAEGGHGRCREAWVPMLLEQWGVPFVGSGPTALALGLDKVMSKRVAAACGVPTPRWVVVGAADPLGLARAAEMPFPLIVKPRAEGSGLGIDRGAVVRDPEALRQRVEWLTQRLGASCLVEEFVPFGELTVFLIGNRPPVALPAIQRPLDPASRLSGHVAGGPAAEWLCPLDLTPALEQAAARAAVAVFEALRCRDLARVDLRVGASGQPVFLEINPLPSFEPDAGLGFAAECLGATYAHLVGEVLRAACARLGLPAAPAAALA